MPISPGLQSLQSLGLLDGVELTSSGRDAIAPIQPLVATIAAWALGDIFERRGRKGQIDAASFIQETARDLRPAILAGQIKIEPATWASSLGLRDTLTLGTDADLIFLAAAALDHLLTERKLREDPTGENGTTLSLAA